MMNKILTIMWKDVRVLFGDWATVALIIAGPLVLALGLGLVTGGFGADDGLAISRIPVLVVDQDGGPIATALRDVLTSDDLSDLLAPEALADADAARARVADGEAAAAIIIPPGFSDSFLPDAMTGDMPAAVAAQVVADPGAPIGAAVVRGIVEEFTARVATSVAGVRLGLTQLATSGAVPPSELAAVGQQLGEGAFGDTTNAAAASLIRIDRQSVTTTGGDDFNALAYFAPSMALLFLMYAVTLGARTLLAERREGTLPRMLAAPVSAGQVLGGKVGGIFLGGFMQLSALILLTTLLFQLNWGNPLIVLLLVVAAALAATGWGLLIAAAAANAGQVTSLGMAVTLLFGILGGSFVPLENAWPALDALSRITPNRWALDGFTALASGETAAVLMPVAALLVMAVVLFAVAALIFRRRQGALLTA
ncbi:MAG: ABC transporter permease [Candidatus Promineofilum sp.]|nr:ABC transporter permease [Promineifilum sp.]